VGRNVYIVALAGAVSVCLAEVAVGQGPPQQPNGGPRISRPMRNGADRWRQMQPDERQRLRSNAERWLQMPPEQQRMLRERDEMRRLRAPREADAALRQSGLQLEAERREQYERRYLQERRRIEQTLRQELEEKRQRELAPVVERLKKEFTQDGKSATAAPSSTAAPSASSAKQQPSAEPNGR
jgi:hypothetical protein